MVKYDLFLLNFTPTELNLTKLKFFECYRSNHSLYFFPQILVVSIHFFDYIIGLNTLFRLSE